MLVHHSVFKYLLTFLCMGMAVSNHKLYKYPLVPAVHMEDSKNSTTIWLLHPRSNKKSNNDGLLNTDHRPGRKRKHEGPNDDMSDKDVTLCWPNPALRECTEVSIPRILYTNLKQHHVPNLAECFCVTEGYDIFESESNEPLFSDGTVCDNGQLHVVRKYTGDPLPHLDISFPDDNSKDDGGDSSEEELGAVCWPNPLLGECKEAEIPHTELNELISEWDGEDFLLDLCTCASQGFNTAIKRNDDADAAARNSPPSRRESYAGVQTYAMTPRVTLCYFDGPSPEYGVWETEGGKEVQKGVFCRQVTIDRGGQYSQQRVIKRFSDVDIYECKGGCVELGYSVLMESASRQVMTIRPQRKGKPRVDLQLIPFRNRKTSPGEWEYTYHSTDYNPRVTLCYFDGEEVQDSSGTLWWNTRDGAAVRKRELCKQVTISRDLYVSTYIAPGRKERFNKYAIYECGDDGCTAMGYDVLQTSKEQQKIHTREDTPVNNGGEGTPGHEAHPPPPTKKKRKMMSSRNKERGSRNKERGRSGKLTRFPLVHHSSRGDRQTRERVDTYVSSRKKMDVVIY